QSALTEAGNYLRYARTQFLRSFAGKPGLRLTCSVEECTNVAERLVDITEKGQGIGDASTSDLLVLTTHGRSGLKRWLLGSVTERVLHGSCLPLLIVHPSNVTSDPEQTRNEEQGVCQFPAETDEA
ncbi:MAG TPA: universal stress protein, partial [Ktedonobacteraceae bacterium]|nr:universal stress protein [Ktedonobacteraceae bacterium]